MVVLLVVVKGSACRTGRLSMVMSPATLGLMTVLSFCQRDVSFAACLVPVALLFAACSGQQDHRETSGDAVSARSPHAPVDLQQGALEVAGGGDATVAVNGMGPPASSTQAPLVAERRAVSVRDCTGVSQYRGADIGFTEVARGFARPVHLVAVPGESGRLVILEQAGLARIGNPGGVWRDFLDHREVVSSEGEQGLLSLAFHPQYLSNGRVFVYYTVGAGDVRLSEFKVTGAKGGVVVDPKSERILLQINQRFSNHFGGQLLFGSDAFLYVGIGDGGSEGDPDNNAQRLDSLLGKILRIDVDSLSDDLAYGIPSDNPFVDQPDAKGEVWALGLRNPWRFSIDRATDRMWIADVGSLSWEEVNIGVRGGNYGWKILEGTHCFAEGCSRGDSVLVGPIWEYGRDRGMAVIGGLVYRGCALPDLWGLYFFSDYKPPDSPLWSLHLHGDSVGPGSLSLETTGAVISSLGEDSAGELYALDHLGGRLLKLARKSP